MIIEDIGNKMNHLIKNKIKNLNYNKKNQKEWIDQLEIETHN